MVLQEIQVITYLDACYYVTSEGNEHLERIFLQNLSAKAVEKPNSRWGWQPILIKSTSHLFCFRASVPSEKDKKASECEKCLQAKWPHSCGQLLLVRPHCGHGTGWVDRKPS